jgi:hypothetical protein
VKDGVGEILEDSEVLFTAMRWEPNRPVASRRTAENLAGAAVGGGRHFFAFQQAKEMCLFAERNFLIKVSSLVDVSLCAMAEFSAQVFSDRWRI